MFGFLRRRKRPPRFKPSGIRIPCREHNVDIPLEALKFGCSLQGCPHYNHRFDVEQLMKNIDEAGTSDENPNKIMNPILKNYLHVELKKGNEYNVIHELRKAKCFNDGRPLRTYCSCTGVEHDIVLRIPNVIAVAGPIGSGKTVLLTVLWYFFEKVYIGKYKIAVRLRPPESFDKITEWLKGMLKDQILPPPNQVGEKTNVEYIVQSGNGHAKWPKNQISLLFVDTWGEIVHQMKAIKENYDYFKLSKNLILIFDPACFPELSKKCVSYGLNILKTRESYEINEILHRLIEYLREEVFIGEITIPMNLSIVVTKCDEYQHLFDQELIQMLGSVHCDDDNSEEPNFQHLNEISHHFKKWLLKFEDPQRNVVNAFVNLAESSFKNVSFFPISALGTRVYKDYIMEDIKKNVKFHDNNHGEHASLDEQSGKDQSYKPPNTHSSQSDSEKEKEKLEVMKIDGQLNPLYVDFPILWLYQQSESENS